MSTSPAASRTLLSRLRYQPNELGFGTSGRRGEVAALTQLEVYIDATGELEFLQSIPRSDGGIVRGEEFCFGWDLRPSSTRFAPEYGRRGEIAQAIERAIRDAGMLPVNAGCVPTPALAHYAITAGRGSMMVTGSHIPFDRNGYKTNTSRGELLKEHEAPVAAMVSQVRERVYGQNFAESAFNEDGMLRSGHAELSPANPGVARAYIDRYVSFFTGIPLRGLRLLFYEHSSAGRDLVPEILERLGAMVIRTGRSDTFVPIDTENIDKEQLATIQHLADANERVDAVVSTDGDSDRPLLLGVDQATGAVEFFAGDLLGMVTAEYLGADAVVVPISCNDAIDRGSLAAVLEPKTRIGSPWVIAGMERARAKGRRVICGWEANGGFLTGSDIERGGRTLTALPTRDAVLPIVCALAAAREAGVPLAEIFARLPRRFGRAGLIRNFPRPVGLAIVQRFSPPRPAAEIRADLARFFSPERGFGEIVHLNYTDGVRITFSNGDVAHLRPSGNADELRIYAVADTPARASEIVAMGIAEPDGILRSLERFVG